MVILMRKTIPMSTNRNDLGHGIDKTFVLRKYVKPAIIRFFRNRIAWGLIISFLIVVTKRISVK